MNFDFSMDVNNIVDRIFGVVEGLCNKFGIAVEYGKENILPQIIAVLQRYRLMKLIILGGILILCLAFVIFGVYSLLKIKHCINIERKTLKRGEDGKYIHLYYDGDDSYIHYTGTKLIIYHISIGVATILFGLFVIQFLKWLIVPEVKYIYMIQDLLNGFQV